ncbi:MAG: hypothetical protein AB1894_11830 [Chloroflexota bacterium]
MKKHTIVFYLALLAFVPLFTACTGTTGENAATRTAQSVLSRDLATQLASSLQETARIEDRHNTATAITAKELATQAVYDQNATLTAEFEHSATAVAQSTAAAAAIQQLIVDARRWPVQWVDSFDQASSVWTVGEKAGQTGDFNLQIAEGKYRLQAQAKNSLLYWVDPLEPDSTAFYLAVEVQQIGGAPDAEAGLVLRASENNFWCFLVDNQQGMFYGQFIDGDWNNSWPMGSSAVHANAPNRLEIIARGPWMLFLINGENFLQVSNDKLLDGRVGLMISLKQAGDQASWEFDNFELRIPPAAATQTTP